MSRSAKFSSPRFALSAVVLPAILLLTGSAYADDTPTTPEARAAATVAAMVPDEKTVLTHSVIAMPFFPDAKIPADAVPGAGYVAGLPRLGVPALKETDAGLGVAWLGGARHDGATALPSSLALASTWNPALASASGAMIGAEARAKGFNVLLAGGANLMRDPRNGRSFEYLSEDPWLTGTLVGAAISGIQSNHIISTIKHFALNDQETGRNFIDARIADAAARESDLLAFQIGIEIGHPGAVMCSYNLVNAAHACDSSYLLNTVLKHDWHYPGFVMSDWGAVPELAAATNGLDQQSGDRLDPQIFFGKLLATAAARDPNIAARLNDMNKRVLTAIYANALDANPVTPGGTIDFVAHGAVALEQAQQGIVLLRNQGAILPLSATAKSIVVIGGYADSGVLSGGGSSQVDGPNGPAVAVPNGGEGLAALFSQQHYHNSPPLTAITRRAIKADIKYRNGQYLSEAVETARGADVVIIFATAWRTEGQDVPDLSLPNGQDALIAAVSAVNPHTIVVLETGGPVLMPWLDHTAAVLEAWYPGAQGGEAIASVLFGQTNPSGHLPVTFPASLDQLPRPKLDGLGIFQASIMPTAPPGAKLAADYDIEGSDVGYRWYARRGTKPLFPFGFGLSYTGFSGSGLKVDGLHAHFAIANVGARSGATVAQLYLVGRNGAPTRRLVGYQRVDLAAGESRPVDLAIDPRLLADWQDGGWVLAGGSYSFALGEDAEHLGPAVSVQLDGRKWKD